MSDPTKSASGQIPLLEWLPGLSERGVAFARQHPRAARAAATIALEAASEVGLGLLSDDLSDDGRIPDSLAPFIVDEPLEDETLTVAEAADRLNVSRPTIYKWIERGKLLGWSPLTKRGHVIPAEQIVSPGKLVGGLPEILEILKNHEFAWVFLTQEMPFADEVTRPIDKLKRGEVDEVVGTAAGWGATPA